jgi:acyl-CoA dehydrogenase
MNVQEARFHRAAAAEASEQFHLDHSPSLIQRTAAVAAAAAADAEDVDRQARFPKAAIDAAREQKLLGIQIPTEFGGYGASIFDVTDMCYTLGRACASTAMIFAMHQTKIACLVRHGTGSKWHETLMRRVAAEQMLLASSTTE